MARCRSSRGCTLKDDDAVDRLLMTMSRFNDRVQAALFDPSRLAPTYSEADVTTPFPFNAYYEEQDIPLIDGESYRLQLSGLIADKRPWSLGDLRGCRSPARLRGSSASRVGARSANGVASSSAIFLSGSAPT